MTGAVGMLQAGTSQCFQTPAYKQLHCFLTVTNALADKQNKWLSRNPVVFEWPNQNKADTSGWSGDMTLGLPTAKKFIRSFCKNAITGFKSSVAHVLRLSSKILTGGCSALAKLFFCWFVVVPFCFPVTNASYFPPGIDKECLSVFLYSHFNNKAFYFSPMTAVFYFPAVYHNCANIFSLSLLQNTANGTYTSLNYASCMFSDMSYKCEIRFWIYRYLKKKKIPIFQHSWFHL